MVHGGKLFFLLTGFESFDGDGRCVVPTALPDLAELAVAQLSNELEAGALNLPLVPGLVREVRRNRFVDLKRDEMKIEALNLCVSKLQE